MSTTEAVSKYLESLGSQMGNIEKSFEDSIRETANKIDQKSSDDSYIGQLRKQLEDNVTKEVVSSQTANKVTATSFIEGRQTQMQEMATSKTATQSTNTKTTIDIGGNLKIEVVVPSGVSSEMVQKILSDAFNSPDFQNLVVKLAGRNTNNFAPADTTY
jgi:translation initiation factor 2 alpha subunit (eIF-2alpha)